MSRQASSPGEAAASTETRPEQSTPPGPEESTAPVAGRPLPPVALYLHIPFCVSLCPYCDFVVVAGAAARGPTNRIAAFTVALESEIGLRADALDARFGPPGTARRPLLRSVYFGGGTPSLVPAETIARLIALVRARFGVRPDAEITIEANPGPDERGDPVALAGAGVNRISFGAQSLDRTELRRLGRRHRPDDVADAVADARAAGIRSINLDLLYDLPDSTLPLWIETLEGALAIRPDHLSLYALTLDDPDAEGLTGLDGDHLPTTRGARQWREFARPGQDEDRAAAQYHHAVHRLSADGWRGYEISNWARKGHVSRHNLAYWERRPYESVGPGSHAFDGASRRWTAARVDRYMEALTPRPGHAAELPPGGSETIDARTAALESVILGLRTDRGLPWSAAEQPPLADEFGWALAGGLLTVNEANRIVLTTRGRLLSNELFARLV